MISLVIKQKQGPAAKPVKLNPINGDHLATLVGVHGKGANSPYEPSARNSRCIKLSDAFERFLLEVHTF